MTFRAGTHNGHTVYWDDNDGADAPSRFVAVGLTAAAAARIADALNWAGAEGDWVADLPSIPRREVT